MFKKTILAISTLFLLNIVAPTLEAKALTFNELPTKQTSKQWSVQVDKAIIYSIFFCSHLTNCLFIQFYAT
ncbi:hypothetical protein IFT92_27870 [Peribacillus simplex]|uniref:hypothetical protein n=1 Tax=Peribacillus TaxID=2675229 RepID=UPI001922F46C|nr:hypothetical protein [Peribacillus simplex]MBD8591536.1 hypothetical protein [Peribacillus simplex]MCD1163852.1 hypothetical protein [Peribacillus castrilensis]